MQMKMEDILCLPSSKEGKIREGALLNNSLCLFDPLNKILPRFTPQIIQAGAIYPQL
jgi:hypothetical protein